VKGFKLPAGDDDRTTWEALEEAGEALRKKKLQLVQLDMESDAYPLVVVPIAKAAELAKLATQAKYGKAKQFGDALAAARKDRIARVAKLAKENALPSKVATSRYVHYARGDEWRWITLPPAKLA
jgi:hypothetical protein